MNNVVMSFYILRRYLENTKADEEVMTAFDTVRNEYTRLLGLCMQIRNDISENEGRNEDADMA